MTLNQKDKYEKTITLQQPQLQQQQNMNGRILTC